MGFARSIHRLIATNKQKEFEQRTKAFGEDYNLLVQKHKCDWIAYIVPLGDGRQAMAALKIIDVTEMLEKEKKDKQAKEQASNKRNK